MTYELSKLRYDDWGLIEYIENYLISNNRLNKKVLDGYLDGHSVTIPSIAVEFDYTDTQDELEIGGEHQIYREFIVEIYEESQGARSDIASLLTKLESTVFTTTDDRKINISEIEILDESNYNFLVDKHLQHYYLTLDNSHLTLSTYYENSFTIDLDINIKSNGTIFDNYVTDHINFLTRGLKIYVESNNLKVKLGEAYFDRIVTLPFTAYFNARHRITVSYSIVGTKHKIAILIDGTKVHESNVFAFASVISSSEFPIFGNNSTLDDDCELDLYALRISNAYENSVAIQSEFLPTTNNDLLYLALNEGKNNRIFSTDGTYLTLNEPYTWTKYSESIYNGLPFYYTALRLKTLGLSR